MPNQTDQLINLQAQQLAAQVANWAAQLDFAKERFRLLELPEMQGKSQLEIDRLAFEKAQDTWKRAMQEATLTGTYNGQPTMEWLTQQAQLTGVLNGQQTLQGKLTDAQITQMNEQMRLANQQFLVQTTGYLDGRPTFEREQWQTGQTGYIGDQATMARQQMEANLSGYFNGRSTLEREKFGADQTQNYLNLLSSLQGPGNAFKQMRVLGATDPNLQNLVSGWAGTYNMPGFGSSGAPGQAQISDLWLGAGMPGSQPYAPNTGPPGMPGQWSPYGQAPGGGGAYVPPGGGPLPVAHQMTIPTYTGPAGITPPAAGEVIPGRGFTPDQWNDATRAAVAAWNAAHPGFIADGSQQGYASTTSGASAPYTAPAPNYGSLGEPYTRWLNQGPGTGQPWISQNELSERWGAMTDAERRAWFSSQPGVTPEQAANALYASWGLQADAGAANLPVPTDPGYAQYIALFGAHGNEPERIYEWSQLSPEVRAYYAALPTSTPTPTPVPPAAAVPPETVSGGGYPRLPPNGFTGSNTGFVPDTGGGGYDVIGGGYPHLPPSGMNTDPAAAAAQAATNNLDVPGYTYSPEGAQAPTGAYNYSATDQGHTQVYPPGVAAPSDQAQVSTQAPVSNSTANSLLATPMPGTGGSLSPNQINAANYNKMNPYAQSFLWAYMENQGWDPQAAKSEFLRSLPKYNGPAQGRIQL